MTQITRFQYSTMLSSVDSFCIPSNIEEIEDFGIFNSKFRNIIIGKNVKKIGIRSIAQNFILESIVFKDSKIKVFPEGAFHRNINLRSIVVPNSLTTLKSEVFRDCHMLQDIELSNTNIIQIMDRCFANCFSLTNICLPASLSELDCNAFESCTNLKTVVINGKIPKLNDFTFFNCKNLESVELKFDIHSISNTCFIGCKNLIKVIANGNNIVSRFRDSFKTCPQIQ